MLDTRYHDLFTLPVDTLVNPINCKGAMGKGLALQFKHRFPGMSQAYRNACRNQSLRPGRRVIMITPALLHVIFGFFLNTQSPVRYAHGCGQAPSQTAVRAGNCLSCRYRHGNGLFCV